MSRIENDRTASLAHDCQAAHVRYQVVVAEAGTALANHQVVGAIIHFARLVDNIHHVTRRQELTLLDIDRLAAGGHGMNEIGLATEESRGLQDVDRGGHRHNIVNTVHISQHRDANLSLHFGKNAQACLQPQATRRLAGATVGLVVRRLEDVIHAEPRADFPHGASDIQAQLQRLRRARAGYQKQGPIQPGLETTKLHFPLACWLASAAFT